VCFDGSAPKDVRSATLFRLKNATNNIVLQGIADPVPLNVTHDRRFRKDWYSDNLQAATGDPRRTEAHPNIKLSANSSSELQTMNSEKANLFARHRFGYNFATFVDRTIREQRREERRLAEQRTTKYQFQARSSCILDGRNDRIARRLLVSARA